ncbi:MAG: hypothetical protein ROZ36_18935 [Thermincola sp.]|nr:hypothetical protein [Thermincola sp.]
MRLCISKSKNASSLYVTKSIYENGKRSTKVVEKLGTYAELEKHLNGQDPIEWAKKYIEELNKKEKEEKREVVIKSLPQNLSQKGSSVLLTEVIFSCKKYTMSLDYTRFAGKFQINISLIST